MDYPEEPPALQHQILRGQEFPAPESSIAMSAWPLIPEAFAVEDKTAREGLNQEPLSHPYQQNSRDTSVPSVTPRHQKLACPGAWRRRAMWAGCSCCGMSVLILGTLLIVYWPQDVEEVSICALKFCGGKNSTETCGAYIERSARENGALELELESQFDNPNSLEVVLRSWSIDIVWTGEAAEEALSQLSSGESDILVTCVGESVTIAAKSQVSLTSTCSLPLKQLSASALQKYYNGHKLEFTQKLSADVMAADLFAISINFKSKQNVQETFPYGDRMYIYDNETLVQANPGKGTTRSVTDTQTEFWGNTPDCPGTIDVPLIMPSLAICDVTLESMNVLALTVRIHFTLKLLNRLGIGLTIHSMRATVYRGNAVLGEGETMERTEVVPHGSTDADAFVEVQFASLDELYEVFNSLISGQAEEIDFDALIDITVLGLDFVLDVPRVRVPLFTASSSNDGNYHLLLGHCTCVYGCDNITGLMACAEANGCSYITDTTATGCPAGYWEDVECTSYGMVDFEYCCPLPDGTCDPATSGCHYLGDIFSTECPTGFNENHQCTRRGYLMDEEFCCPTTECSITDGCFWNRDAMQSSVCPSGYRERPSCTNHGYLWDEEFCCPQQDDSAAPSGSDSPAPSPEPPNVREPGDCREYGGCYFHETFYDAECPAGYFEVTECTDYGYFIDSEFCCPS